MGALGQTQTFDESAATGHTLSQFLVSNGVDLVAQRRFIGVFLGEPVNELSHGRKVRDALVLFLRE